MCKRVKTEASRPLLTCRWLRLVNSPSCLLHGQPPRGRMRSVLGNLPEHTLTTGRCGGPGGAGGQGTTPLATSVLWFSSQRRDQGSPLPPAARVPRRTLAGAPLLLTRTRGRAPGWLSGMPPFRFQPPFARPVSRACLNGRPCPWGAQSCLCRREAAAGRGVSRRDWPHSSPARGRGALPGNTAPRAPKCVSPGKWGA